MQFANNSLVKFEGLNLTLNYTRHGAAAAIPDATYNIYTEYSGATFMFAPSPSNPSKASLYRLMRMGITPVYLLDTVRKLTGTPFEMVVAAFMAKPKK